MISTERIDLNKVDYTKQKRTFETDYLLAEAEVTGLTARHEALSACSPEGLSPKECQEFASSLNKLEDEIKQRQADKLRIRSEQLALEQMHIAGFDYERPASTILNRLLPPVPENTKEVTYNTISKSTTGRNWALALIVTAASFGYMFWLMHALPVAFAAGALGFFIGGPAVADPSMIQLAVQVFTWVVVASVLLLVSRIPLNLQDYQHSERVARYFLGAQHWNWAQRVWSCMLYSVSSPWIIIAPLVVVPVRFVIAIALLWTYLHTEDSSATAPEAITAAGRFYSAYQRVMFIAGAIACTLIVILLIVM